MTKLSPRTLRRLMMAGFAAGIVGNLAVGWLVLANGIPPIANIGVVFLLAFCFYWWHRDAERIEGNLEAWREK